MLPGGSTGPVVPTAITMKWSAEDWKQYNMWINGIYSPDMDASEIGQYRMYAQSQGVTPKAPGGVSGVSAGDVTAAIQGGGLSPLPASMMLDGEDRKQYEEYKAGIITPDMDQAELQRYAMIAKAEGVTPKSPSSASDVTGAIAAGGMGGEDIKQYNLYINGFLTPDMDQAEIIKYSMYAKSQGIKPKQPFQMIPGSVMLKKPRQQVVPGLNTQSAGMFGFPMTAIDGSQYVAAVMSGVDPKTLPPPKDGFDKSEMMMLYYMQAQGNSTGATPQFSFPQYGIPGTSSSIPVAYNPMAMGANPMAGMGYAPNMEMEDMWPLIYQQMAQSGGSQGTGSGVNMPNVPGTNIPLYMMDNYEYKGGMLVPDAARLRKPHISRKR